tara:strand:- start:2574 stop:3128 length:555 start_codon:yes stop_codon:yes gene_type:complete
VIYLVVTLEKRTIEIGNTNLPVGGGALGLPVAVPSSGDHTHVLTLDSNDTITGQSAGALHSHSIPGGGNTGAELSPYHHHAINPNGWAGTVPLSGAHAHDATLGLKELHYHISNTTDPVFEVHPTTVIDTELVHYIKAGTVVVDGASGATISWDFWGNYQWTPPAFNAGHSGTDLTKHPVLNAP